MTFEEFLRKEYLKQNRVVDFKYSLWSPASISHLVNKYCQLDRTLPSEKDLYKIIENGLRNGIPREPRQSVFYGTIFNRDVKKLATALHKFLEERQK